MEFFKYFFKKIVKDDVVFNFLTFGIDIFFFLFFFSILKEKIGGRLNERASSISSNISSSAKKRNQYIGVNKKDPLRRWNYDANI